jgi:hypothetical protein
METMIKYGIMKDWDETIRAQARIEKIRARDIEAQTVAVQAIAPKNKTRQTSYGIRN